MANFFRVLGSETKALVRKVSFAPAGGATNYGGYGGYGGAPISLLHRGDFGASGPLDFAALVGDPLSNSVVAACVAAVAKAIPDAPPLLERRVSADEEQWERVCDHPLLQLLNRPNGYQSSADVRGLTVAQEMTRGEAFWYLAFDGTVPREIWVWPTEKVMVESQEDEPISGYTLTGETGAPIRVGNHEIIHFRYLPSVYNWRRGWTPLVTGARQIAGDSAAATYHSAILSNAGVLSLLISLKDSSAAGEVTPGQLQEYLDQLKRKLSGNGAGAMAGLDLPLDVHKIGYSPDEMALDKLINYYESRICALMGVDPMVCGLGSGTMQKTYANLGEALNDFWERQIVPMLRRHASTLTAQLFPSFGMEPSEWRLSFDTSEVAALQENVDALFTRWRELWQAGGIDLYTLQTKIGLPQVPQEYKERFFGDKPNDRANSSAGDAGIKVIDRNGMSHDELGRFDGGGFGRAIYHFPPDGVLPGVRGAFDSLHSWTGGRLPEKESAEYQAGKAQACQELQPFTQLGSKEHGLVVLERNGEITNRSYGSNTSVAVPLPPGERVAMMHTHDYEGAHSFMDWSQFLTNIGTTQSHVLTASTTYSLFKPRGWKAEDYGLSTISPNDSKEEIFAKRGLVEAIYLREQEKYIMESGTFGFPGWEEKTSIYATQKVAAQYGIIFRIGKRNKGAGMEEKNGKTESKNESEDGAILDSAAWEFALSPGGGTLYRMIREEISKAKANAVITDDEETAARRVTDWVRSQLPRIYAEYYELRAQGLRD